MRAFKELIGNTVDKLILVVWPPWGEEKESDIDISFGLVFKDEPNILCVISVDKNELWSPHISYQPLPQIGYMWEDFYPRMKEWMKAENDDSIIDVEYYDVTKCELFKKIVSSKIRGIELMNIEDIADPFGVKILFEDDYIISIPNSDGNTVETKIFNNNGSVEKFKQLGNW